MPAFGVHFFAWSEEAEAVAADRIKKKAKKTYCGSKLPLRDSCYERKCLSRIYFLAPFLLFAAITALSKIAFPQLKMHQYVASFEKTRCTTVSVNLTELEIPCNCQVKKEQECQKQYHCVQFEVKIKTNSGHKITTFLYEDIEALGYKYEHCAVLNRECKKHDPEKVVMSLVEHYGEEGSQFNCLYNPEEESEVVLSVKPLKISFWAFFIFMFVCSIASIVVPCIAYFTCGTMWLCTKDPPADVLAEVERRAAGGGPEEEEAPAEVATEEPPTEMTPLPTQPEEEPQVSAMPEPTGQPAGQQQMGQAMPQGVPQVPASFIGPPAVFPPIYGGHVSRSLAGYCPVPAYPNVGGIFIPGTPFPRQQRTPSPRKGRSASYAAPKEEEEPEEGEAEEGVYAEPDDDQYHSLPTPMPAPFIYTPPGRQSQPMMMHPAMASYYPPITSMDDWADQPETKI